MQRGRNQPAGGRPGPAQGCVVRPLPMKSPRPTATSRFSTSTWTNPSSPSMDRLSGDSIWWKATGSGISAIPAWRRLTGYFCPSSRNSWRAEDTAIRSPRILPSADLFIEVRVHDSDRIGRSGSIGDVRYKYKPRENFWFTADLGISRGIAAARDGCITLATAIPSWARCGTCRWNLRLWAPTICVVCIRTSRGRATSPRSSRRTLAFYNDNLVLPGHQGSDHFGLGQSPLSAHQALGRLPAERRPRSSRTKCRRARRFEISPCPPAWLFNPSISASMANTSFP